MTWLDVVLALLWGLLGGYLFRFLRERREYNERSTAFEERLRAEREIADYRWTPTKEAMEQRFETLWAQLDLERQRKADQPATVTQGHPPEALAQMRSKEMVLQQAVDQIQTHAKVAGLSLTVAEATAEARRVLNQAGMEGFGEEM